MAYSVDYEQIKLHSEYDDGDILINTRRGKAQLQYAFEHEQRGADASNPTPLHEVDLVSQELLDTISRSIPFYKLPVGKPSTARNSKLGTYPGAEHDKNKRSTEIGNLLFASNF